MKTIKSPGYGVLVYKTDVPSAEAAEKIVKDLQKCYPDHIVFFDLFQSHNILWVEGWDTKNLIVVESLRQFGYQCEMIED